MARRRVHPHRRDIGVRTISPATERLSRVNYSHLLRYGEIRYFCIPRDLKDIHAAPPQRSATTIDCPSQWSYRSVASLVNGADLSYRRFNSHANGFSYLYHTK
jgi:hypothetical protein